LLRSPMATALSMCFSVFTFQTRVTDRGWILHKRVSRVEMGYGSGRATTGDVASIRFTMVYVWQNRKAAFGSEAGHRGSVCAAKCYSGRPFEVLVKWSDRMRSFNTRNDFNVSANPLLGGSGLLRKRAPLVPKLARTRSPWAGDYRFARWYRGNF